VFVSLAREVYHKPFASLRICRRFSLLHFSMRTKTIFDDIQANSVLDFPSTKTTTKQSKENKERRKSETCPSSRKFHGS